ncbi:MAG: hypothetical protein SFY70_09195 [Bacteroidia bacterium]|nr:hypothetical protein [Bacteroidia bacterium]
MRQFLEHATGLSIYPLLGMALFIGFFLLVVVQMVFTSKRHYREMAQLPLDTPDSTPTNPNHSSNHVPHA